MSDASPQPTSPELSAEEITTRLRQTMRVAARLQLFVSSALIWLIFIFAAMPGGIPPAVPTLLLGAWLVATTLALNYLAVRGDVQFLTSQMPGRIALLVTVLTVLLATMLVRDAASDYYLIYFFPITVATIYYGLRGGLATATLSTLTYALLAIVTTGTFPFYPLLNRILFFFAVAGAIGVGAEGQLALISELRRAYSDLKDTVESLAATRAKLARRIAESDTLARVARDFTATLDAERVLRTVLEQVEALMGAEAATLMTLDARTNELVFQIPLGSKGTQLQGYRLSVGQGIAGTVAQTGQPLRVDNTAADERHFQNVDQKSGFHTRSILCVPMTLQDRVTGVLEVMNKKEGVFTADDENLLTSVAQWAAIAIENARLYQDLQNSMDELKRAQEQLVRTERLRALGEMAGGVAHDFNNLLTIIIAEAQLLNATSHDDRDTISLQRIEHAARDAAEAVRRLQEYTRVRRDAPREVVELDELIYQSVEITRPRWRSVADLNLQVDPVGAVVGSPSELREVLTNLIFNAVDARAEDRPCQVTVRTRREEGKWAVLTIEDNGSGIPPDVLPHIFDPYFTTKPHGTGLGLSVAYGIITRHGGEIHATSPLNGPDGGTRFEIRLPLTVRTNEAAEPQTASTTIKQFQRILFVDDDINILAAASNLLTASGYEVITARTASEAEQQILRGEYDVLMTDLTMPEVSGWDLAKRVKDLIPPKPVVLVTGWGLQIDSEQMKSGMVDAVLGKPFAMADLNRVLEELARTSDKA